MPVLFDRGPCKIVGFKGEPMQKHLQCNEGGGGELYPDFIYQTATRST